MHVLKGFVVVSGGNESLPHHEGPPLTSLQGATALVSELPDPVQRVLEVREGPGVL